MEWIQANIAAFGGDPTKVTLIGSGSGAADIICHLLSRQNAIRSPQCRLFSRAIIQSPVFEPIIPDVSSAGWMLSRMMSSLQVRSIEDFRNLELERLLSLCQNLRIVDDGVWFRDGWSKWLQGESARGRESHGHHHHNSSNGELLSPSWQARPGRSGGMGVCSAGAASLLPSSPVFGTRRSGGEARNKSRSKSRSARHSTPRSPSRHHLSSSPVSPTPRPLPPSVSGYSCPAPSVSSTPLQPIIIGDSASDSLLWSAPISLWTSTGVVRRLKALCQSMSKTAGILRQYDISPYTPEDEIPERVLDLVDDARIAWPTDVLSESMLREGNSKVWRYVFDQEGPARGIPHHAADLMYLFDWKPASIGLGTLLEHAQPTLKVDAHGSSSFWEGPFDVDEEEEEKEKPIVSHDPPSLGSISLEAALTAVAESEAASTSKIDPNLLASSIVTSSSMSMSSSGSDTSMRSVDDTNWLMSTVDQYTYLRVRDTMQEKWLAFAYGEEPWTAWSGSPHYQSNNRVDSHTPTSSGKSSVADVPSNQSEKVFIFGPEGEIGERGTAIFDGRRRRVMWNDVFDPLGWALVQKLGVELSRGPACADRTR